MQHERALVVVRPRHEALGVLPLGAALDRQHCAIAAHDSFQLGRASRTSRARSVPPRPSRSRRASGRAPASSSARRARTPLPPVGISVRRRATRTCSRAVFGDIEQLNATQCAHNLKPPGPHPPRASNSATSPSQRAVAALMCAARLVISSSRCSIVRTNVCSQPARTDLPLLRGGKGAVEERHHTLLVLAGVLLERSDVAAVLELPDCLGLLGGVGSTPGSAPRCPRRCRPR